MECCYRGGCNLNVEDMSQLHQKYIQVYIFTNTKCVIEKILLLCLLEIMDLFNIDVHFTMDMYKS